MIGIILGPNEPELTLNSYIDQLVSDLLEFWSGVPLAVNVGSYIQQKIVNVPLFAALVIFQQEENSVDFLVTMLD